MDTLFDKKEEKGKGLNKGFLIGGIVGVFVIAIIILVAMQRPSMGDQEAAVLADAHRDGSPQFGEITQDIIISTGDNTVEYANAFGGISMAIVGNIRNKGNRAINGLEVNVAVVDQFNQMIKDKSVLVVPKQQEVLAPGDSIPITLTLDGFTRDDDRANIRWKVTAIRVAQ